MQIPVDPNVSGKLTDWSKEPSLQDLKFDLQGAKPTHDALMQKIDRWNDLNRVTGKAAAPKTKGRSSVQPKLIRRQNEWRYSALTEPFLGSHKLFDVRPATFEDGEAAKQNELLLNHQFKTVLNRVKFIDDYIRCGVDEGTVILRTGWRRTTKKIKEMTPVYEHTLVPQEDEEQMTAFQEALAARKDDPRSFSEMAPPELIAALDYFDETQQITTAEEVGEEEVEVVKVIANHPTLTVLNPKNVYIDPSCEGDFTKAMFAIVSFETSKAELLKETDRYKNIDKVDWDNAGTITEPDHATQTPTDFQFKDAARKRVVAYEYWGFYDVEGKGELRPIVATWIGNTMIRLEENPFPDEKIPLTVVNYLPMKRELAGETDAELLEDNQKILGAVSRGMIDMMGRSANGQQGFAKGMLDPLNRRRYEQGMDYEFNPNMPPQNGLIEHKYPEIPNSALTMLQLQNQEAEALTGVKSFSGGMTGNAYGDVAAGIRGTLDAASKREMAILRRFSKGLTDVGNKIIAMNAVFLSEEETVRITNSEFVKIRREDLKGNFDLNIDISTAEVDDSKAKDLGFMLQTIGPNMDAGMTTLILSDIARLKQMPELAKQLKNYKPAVDPVEEKLKELAVQKAELENQVLQSQIDLNNAKAIEAKAGADKKNLDFVEQETGTTHARQMEHSQAQAEANQDLTITKALVQPKKENEEKPDIETAVGYNQLVKGIAPDRAPIDTTGERDALAESDPRYSIGSRFYDPSLDPATNPNLAI